MDCGSDNLVMLCRKVNKIACLFCYLKRQICNSLRGLNNIRMDLYIIRKMLLIRKLKFLLNIYESISCLADSHLAMKLTS